MTETKKIIEHFVLNKNVPKKRKNVNTVPLPKLAAVRSLSHFTLYGVPFSGNKRCLAGSGLGQKNRINQTRSFAVFSSLRVSAILLLFLGLS